jgi:hypothetical protein
MASDKEDIYPPNGPFIHPRNLLTHMPAVTVTAEVCTALRNGRSVNLPEYSDARFVRVFWSQEGLLGVAERVAGTLFKPKTILYGSNEKLPEL